MIRMVRIIISVMLIFSLLGCTNGSSIVSNANKTDSTTNVVDSTVNNDNNTNDASNVVDLIMYLADEEEYISAHILSVDVIKGSIDLKSDEIFKTTGEIGWQDRIYPLSISDGLLVLPEMPVKSPDLSMKCTVSTENERYSGDYTLLFDAEQFSAVIKKGSQSIGVLELSLEETHFTPQAFFVDGKDKVVVLCETVGDTFDKVYPVSLIFTEKDGSFVLEQNNEYSSMFDVFEFSKINMPTYTSLETNVYGNAQSETFIWNEGANIVEINPYQGTANTIFSVSKVESDMPHLDTYRDFYGFFTGVGYQNGIYIAKFPDYNNLAGTVAVFYNNKGEFLGSVLGTEHHLSLLDKNNIETARIENEALNSLLFISQENLNS